MTLGDRARLELAVHNVEGVAGSYTIVGQQGSRRRGAETAIGFERTVALAAGERKREAFELKPAEVGLIKLAPARHRPKRH